MIGFVLNSGARGIIQLPPLLLKINTSCAILHGEDDTLCDLWIFVSFATNNGVLKIL